MVKEISVLALRGSLAGLRDVNETEPGCTIRDLRRDTVEVPSGQYPAVLVRRKCSTLVRSVPNSARLIRRRKSG